MSKPFTISFGFALEHSTETIQITAVAQLHHSNPYYVIDSFHFDDVKQKKDSVSLLPSLEIELVKRKGKSFWVHKDSHRVSLLSVAIGKAIEQSGHLHS